MTSQRHFDYAHDYCVSRALVRPGRFDRHIAVPLPDVRGRAQILTHHMKDVTTAMSTISCSDRLGLLLIMFCRCQHHGTRTRYRGLLGRRSPEYGEVSAVYDLGRPNAHYTDGNSVKLQSRQRKKVQPLSNSNISNGQRCVILLDSRASDSLVSSRTVFSWVLSERAQSLERKRS